MEAAPVPQDSGHAVDGERDSHPQHSEMVRTPQFGDNNGLSGPHWGGSLAGKDRCCLSKGRQGSNSNVASRVLYRVQVQMGHILGRNFLYLDVRFHGPTSDLLDTLPKCLGISSTSKKIVLGVISPTRGGESCIRNQLCVQSRELFPSDRYATSAGPS